MQRLSINKTSKTKVEEQTKSWLEVKFDTIQTCKYDIS